MSFSIPACADVYIPPSKIVSGGQTGVDRGALDAALATSFPCGGWCRAGRKAEDGPISATYPLKELPGAGYRQRTRQNVVDSDGTLVIYFGELAGSTRETVRFCEQFSRPVLVHDGAKKVPSSIAIDAMRFAAHHRIAVLNVAGPRESICPGAQIFAAKVVTWIIESKREYETLPEHSPRPSSLEDRERSRQFYAEMRWRDENPALYPIPEEIEENRRYWEENKDLFPDPPRSGPRS